MYVMDTEFESKQKPSRGTASGRLSGAFWLSAVTTVWMFVVNMFGFVDTFTDSSLSLGRTWPFTQQGLFPSSWDAAKFIEYTHRVLVGGLLILLLALTVWVWLRYRDYVEAKVLSLIAVVFVLAEAVLGAMAVLLVTPPAVTASHMGVALVAFCAVTVLTGVIRRIDQGALLQTHGPLRTQPVSRGFRALAWFTLVYVLFAIYFGSFVAATGAGGAFQGWPIPTESPNLVHGLYWIDVTHRSVAAGLVVLLVTLTVWARRIGRRDLMGIGIGLLCFAMLQAASGALLIYTLLSVQAFLLHVMGITCIFALSAYLAVWVLPEPARRWATANAPDTDDHGPRKRTLRHQARPVS
ncbi:MAG: COX15/CtaA family protein [Alicyclobacillus sp.]|nr:COX15/CtaA family protein [Alicyclobacillus sp.]